MRVLFISTYHLALASLHWENEFIRWPHWIDEKQTVDFTLRVTSLLTNLQQGVNWCCFPHLYLAAAPTLRSLDPLTVSGCRMFVYSKPRWQRGAQSSLEWLLGVAFTVIVTLITLGEEWFPSKRVPVGGWDWCLDWLGRDRKSSGIEARFSCNSTEKATFQTITKCAQHTETEQALLSPANRRRITFLGRKVLHSGTKV